MWMMIFFCGFFNCHSESSLPEDVSFEYSQFLDIQRISKGVADLALQDSEKVWERVSWVSDVSTAKSLAIQTQRPIFLFSMHGELDGRC